MARKVRTTAHDGAYWFSIEYAAELLGMRPCKIETLVATGRLTSREDRGTLWIAESDVTALRRDPAALKTIKATLREPRAPSHGKPARCRAKARSPKPVPHTIEPTAPPIVIDPFNVRRATQEVLPWTTDRPGFAWAHPRRDKDT